jgi:hypothetical protein
VFAFLRFTIADDDGDNQRYDHSVCAVGGLYYQEYFYDCF